MEKDSSVAIMVVRDDGVTITRLLLSKLSRSKRFSELEESHRLTQLSDIWFFDVRLDLFGPLSSTFITCTGGRRSAVSGRK